MTRFYFKTLVIIGVSFIFCACNDRKKEPKIEKLITPINKEIVNPANEIFYTQNTFYNTKLKPHVHENIQHQKRWGLHNNFLKR